MSGGVNVICCNIMCYVCIVTQVKIHVTRLKQDVTLRKMRVSCREFILATLSIFASEIRKGIGQL